jgi:hypothetical protein
MGRPLKIQKTSPGSGNGGASVGVDLAYPNFASVTAPVYNSVDTLNSTQYLGVVGGAVPTDAPTTTNPVITVQVNIANPSGTGLGVATGYIIRQKGSHKYLVGDTTGVNDGSFIVGQAYQISTLGTTTNWVTAGAGSDAALGDIFTAVSVGGAGNGAAFSVGVCVLADDDTPAAGLMAIGVSYGDGSSNINLSKLTNKWALDWTGGSDYASTSVIGDVRYAANFFTDEGTVIKSGTTGAANTGTPSDGQQNLVGLALVDNITS